MFNREKKMEVETSGASSPGPTVKKPEPESGSGTFSAYRVEARYMGYEGVTKIGETVLTKEWQHVYFPEASIGVPRCDPYHMPQMVATRTLSYTAAQALRWWFHAAANAERLGGLCVETRLVVFKIEYSHSALRTGEILGVGGDTPGHASARRPDVPAPVSA